MRLPKHVGVLESPNRLQRGHTRTFPSSIRPCSWPHFLRINSCYLNYTCCPVFMTDTRGCWQIPSRRKGGANQLLFRFRRHRRSGASHHKQLSSCQHLQNFLTRCWRVHGTVEFNIEIPQLGHCYSVSFLCFPLASIHVLTMHMLGDPGLKNLHSGWLSPSSMRGAHYKLSNTLLITARLGALGHSNT